MPRVQQIIRKLCSFGFDNIRVFESGCYWLFSDTTAMDHEALPLQDTKTTIGREDVAEEILRVATLPNDERIHWHGHGVYLVDMK